MKSKPLPALLTCLLVCYSAGEVRAIDEDLGRFSIAKQQQIRSILAGTLRGIVSQRLLPRAEGGRVPAVEVMVTNARIQDLIRENRPDEITDAIAAGEFFQMQSFAQSLIDLVISGEVDREIAANAATSRHDFLVALEQAEKDQAAITREEAALHNGSDAKPKAVPPPASGGATAVRKTATSSPGAGSGISLGSSPGTSPAGTSTDATKAPPKPVKAVVEPKPQPAVEDSPH